MRADGAAFTWLVVFAALGGLAATLPGAAWPPALVFVVLIVASIATSAIVVPMPGGGYQTMTPIVTAAALVLFGAPATVVAMGVGIALGNGLLHRRPIMLTMFNAAQVMLATVAARFLAYIVIPSPATWTLPVLLAQPEVPFTLAVISAAFAFVLISTVLVSVRVAIDRRTAFLDVLMANLLLELVNTTVLFAFGTVVALVITRTLPPSALFLSIPAAMVTVTLLMYAGRRQVVEELEMLYTTATEMNRSLSIGEIVQTLANGIERLVASDIFMVFLRDSAKAEPRLAHYDGPGIEPSAKELPPVGIAAQVLRTGRAIRVGDYERDPRRSPTAETVFGRGAVRSAIVVPITSGWDVWGAVLLAKGTRNAYTDRHERLLTTLAGQAALAIRNAHLSEDSQRQVERLAALQHLGRQAGGTLDLDEAYRHLVVQAAETVGARYAFLSLYDERTRELGGQAVYGTDEGEFKRLRTRVDVDAIALYEAVKAFRDRRPVMSEDLQNSPSPCPSLQGLADASCALTVPLLKQGRPIGALTIVRTEPQPFVETEIATIEAIATQGAVAIENARLHTSMTTRLTQMEAMINISRRLTATQDLREIFRVIAETAHDVLGITRCALLTWDAQGNLGESFSSGLSEEFSQALRQQFRAGIGGFMGPGLNHLVLPDLGSDLRMGRLRAAAASEGLKSGAFIPLRSKGEVLGVLTLLHDRSHEFPPDQLRLAEAFAEQASVAAEHTILLAQSERRRDEVVLVNRIVGSVSASLDLSEIMRTAATELASATGAPRVAIYRVGGSWLRLAAQTGTPALPADVPVTTGLMGRVVRSGRAEYLTGPRDDPDDITRSLDASTRAAVPILLDGTAAGIILIDGTAAHPVTPQMFELLIALAQQLSVAVRNASLYEELRKAHDELQVLYEAAKSVSGTLDLHTLLDSLVSVTCRSFGYDNGTLMLVGQETSDLSVAASYGYSESITGMRIPNGVGITGWVARTGSPLMVDDVRQDSRYYRTDERTRSELAVPLIADGKVLGVFNVESSRLAAFGQRDMHMLTTLASYAVIAIQNAHLYEHAQRLAITDGLTELFNRRYLYEAMDRVIERGRRDGQPLSLIMLEIDNFKRCNDTYGHQSGDEVLRTVSMLLRRGSRPSDIVARYGGDEFMVVLPGATKSAAQETAERLRRAVEAYPLILGTDVIATVTLSVGVATFPADGRTVDALVEAVDQAQYIAKRSGGNKVHVAQTA
jgi:diguanylate cyclase (GGDEF)-like protein